MDFYEVFHDFHHPFWGVPLFLETPTWPRAEDNLSNLSSNGMTFSVGKLLTTQDLEMLSRNPGVAGPSV